MEARSQPLPGRPWSTKVAWGALWMLSGLETPWLEAHHPSRIRARLSQKKATDIIWATRRRAVTRRYRASPGVLSALGSEIVVSGTSVENASSRDTMEGYVDDARLSRLVDRYPMILHRDGNVVLRVTDFLAVLDRDVMPEAVVAVDLAEATSPGEAARGLVRLDELLAGEDEGRRWITAREAATDIRRELARGDEEYALRILARALSDLRSLTDPADIARFLTEPEPTGDSRWDTLLGAIIRRECRALGLPSPSWTDHPTLDTWWFPLLADPSLTARTMARTPLDLSLRGIWLEAKALETR